MEKKLDKELYPEYVYLSMRQTTAVRPVKVF